MGEYDPFARMRLWEQYKRGPPAPPYRQADGILEGDGVQMHFRLPVLPRLKELERQYVLYVLDICEGNKIEAAHTLGMALSTLYRKLGRYRLEELGYR